MGHQLQRVNNFAIDGAAPTTGRTGEAFIQLCLSSEFSRRGGVHRSPSGDVHQLRELEGLEQKSEAPFDGVTASSTPATPLITIARSSE